MSEQDSNKPLSSGILPGARRPTVIGAKIGTPDTSPSQKLGPTIIGSVQQQGLVTTNAGANPQKLKPTVIGGGETNAHPVAAKPKTTVITSPSVVTTKPEEPVIVKKPSVIPGTVRKGLEVSVLSLGKVFPGSSPEMLTRVETILKGTIVETLNAASCSQWGSKTQVRYTELVNESLNLTSAKVVQDSIRHNIRLYELLEEVAVSFQAKNSKVFQIWKKVQTPWEKFQSVRNELDQLRENLGRALPLLRSTQSSLEGISLEFQSLIAELDALSVSANYIADHLGSNDPRSAHLMDQSMSLMKMIAQIQEGVILRNATVQEIDAIADRIQEGVLVTLPAWIEKASLAMQRTSMNETEEYTLRQGLEEIIQQLK